MAESNIGPTPRTTGFPEKRPRWDPLTADCGGPETRRPGLLVSVRSVEEACQAAGGHADIIDVKEPRQGALGAATPQVWREIAERVPAERPLSAALGEAREADEAAADVFPRRLAQAAAALPDRFTFAKLGPAGVADAACLERRWERVREALPAACRLVAVAYADPDAAGTLPPETILQRAADIGITWWLLDTFEKRGRSVIDLLGGSRLAALALQAQQCRLRWVLAGSMRRSDPPVWQAWRPDVIGVRGDVCQGGRTGRLDVEAIKQWRERLGSVQLESLPGELD